jgi:hypothetical protein
MTYEEAEKHLERLAADLGEHFDAIQIMVSWEKEGGGTYCTKKGFGNWFARQGMAHDFILANGAQEHAAALSAQLKG